MKCSYATALLDIDVNLWNQDIDILSGPSKTELTTYFVQKVVEVQNSSIARQQLRDVLREDFKGWTPYQWKQINRSYIFTFFDLCRARGIVVRDAPNVIDKLLYIFLDTVPPTPASIHDSFAAFSERKSYKAPNAPRKEVNKGRYNLKPIPPFTTLSPRARII